MKKILTDLSSGRHYAADGSRLAEPVELLLGGTEELEWQFYTAAGNGTPEQWTKAAFPSGVTASCSAIDRFRRCLSGTAKQMLAAGTALTQVEILCNSMPEEFAPCGTLRFRPATGAELSCDYTALTRTADGIAVAVNWTPAADIPQGTEAELPAAPYCAALSSDASSDPATGKFVFSLLCDSRRLRRLAAVAESEFAPECKGLETVLYRNVNARMVPLAAVRLEDVRIRLLAPGCIAPAAPLAESTLAVWLTNTVKAYAGINPVSAACNDGTVKLEAATRIYTVTPDAAVAIRIDAGAVTPVVGTTFEIWVDLTAGVQEVAWPDGLVWLEGSEPDLSGAELYVAVYRYYGPGIGWRANLADHTAG